MNIKFEEMINTIQLGDSQQLLHHASINTTTRYLKQVDRDKNKTEYNVANAIFGELLQMDYKSIIERWNYNE